MRCASASALFLAAVLAVAGACSPATAPRPLPPRRADFSPPRAPRLQAPPDLARPAEPPVRHQRYFGWILAADLVAIVPLAYWIFRPEDVYLAMPSLILPPAIHVAYGQPRTAAISFLMRAAMLGGVYLAGRSAEAECDDSSSFVCVPIGSLILADVAVTSVVIVDAMVLARRTRDDEGWHRLPVVPSVSATPQGGVMLNLSIPR